MKTPKSRRRARITLEVRTAIAARDAVTAQLDRARELAAMDARYRVTVASLEYTLRDLSLAIAVALSTPPKDRRP